MADKKEIFADGVGRIHFAGGLVRLDLMSLQPGEDGKAATDSVHTRIIMPPKGFLAAYNSMGQLLEKLAAAGVVKKDEKAK